MASQNHIHTYVQFKARPGYFRCAAADCTHFLIREAVIGKYSKCPDCGTQFTIDFQNAKRMKPKCLNCEQTKKGRAYRMGQNLTKSIVKFSVGDGMREEEE